MIDYLKTWLTDSQYLAKWVLINQPRIPQMPQNFSAQNPKTPKPQNPLSNITDDRIGDIFLLCEYFTSQYVTMSELVSLHDGLKSSWRCC